MSRKQHSRKSFILILTVFILVGLLAVGTQYTLANQTTYSADQKEVRDSPTSLDDQAFDVGIEWINNYPSPYNDVSSNDESCNGLYNAVYTPGSPHNFFYSEENAWAKDYKNQTHDGNENNWVDNVDIAMVCSIGVNGSVIFANSGGLSLSPSEAAWSYGDKDLEWLAFDTSNIFNDNNWSHWLTTMNGAHLLLGYKNQMYLSSNGDGTLWGQYMNGSPEDSCFPPRSIMQAWFQAVDDLQPINTCARVLAEREDSLNDYLWGKGYVSNDDPVDMYGNVIDHCLSSSGQKTFLVGTNQPEVLSMPIVQVMDRVVDVDYVVNTIAPAFGLEDITPCFYENKYLINSSTGGITLTLQVDAETGSYSFHNLSSLWTTPIVAPTLPSELRAAEIIDEWFNSTPAEGLPAMQYRNPAEYEYNTEAIVGLIKPQAETSNEAVQKISELPVDISMTYPRSLSVMAGTASGYQMVDFPMVGPGARLKIYLGDSGEIIGVQGGSRDVQVMSQQVTILDASKVWASFLADRSLAIPEVSIVADTITYTLATLAYYEMPYTQHQNDLIPVWDFNINFYTNGVLTDENVQIYVPAALAYLPPQVAILNPEDGATFWAGEPISLEGYINQGTPPYTIQWTSSSDGYLGNTLNIIASLGSEIRTNIVFNPTVSLQVMDANGLTSTATITLAIKPIFWLPLITK
jgi:Family of unknown function (DUF6345)